MLQKRDLPDDPVLIYTGATPREPAIFLSHKGRHTSPHPGPSPPPRAPGSPLQLIPYWEYNVVAVWAVEYTDEIGHSSQGLLEGQQDAVAARVELLMEHGPNLPYPYSSDIRGSRHGVVRELRAHSRAGLSGSSTSPTPGEHRYSSSAETRRATTGSTRSTCRLPTTSMTSIWMNFERRD